MEGEKNSRPQRDSGGGGMPFPRRPVPAAWALHSPYISSSRVHDLFCDVLSQFHFCLFFLRMQMLIPTSQKWFENQKVNLRSSVEHSDNYFVEILSSRPRD